MKKLGYFYNNTSFFFSTPSLPPQLLLWLYETQSISLEEHLFHRSGLVGWVGVFVPLLSFPAALIIHFLSCFLHDIIFIILSLQHHQIIASRTHGAAPVVPSFLFLQEHSWCLWPLLRGEQYGSK